MALDALAIVEPLVGSTIYTPSHHKPNEVLAIEGASAIVATERSPSGEPISLRQIQRGLDMLLNAEEVPVAPSTFGGYRRSSAIGAILASLPNTEIVEASPTRVRLRSASPLRDRFEEACSLVSQPRDNAVVTSTDQFNVLMAEALPELLLLHVNDAQSYKVQGSAGQLNFLWAETPWTAVMNRLVTTSAQRGHYLVFLVDGAGQSIYLSLNQGVTEAAAAASGDYRQYLRRRADQFRGYLASQRVDDLILKPLELTGSGRRTQGYAWANIAAVQFSSGAIPHDAVLGIELRRFLRLYEAATAGLDEDHAIPDPDTPEKAKRGIEGKRYRWHLRAEGRNSAIAREAKRLNGDACQICGRDFGEELGELGRACIEAHHLVPFGDLDSQPRDLHPEEDFAVVCANCHRMLHSETPPMKPEQLAALLRDGGSP